MALDDSLLTEEQEAGLEPTTIDGTSIVPSGEGVIVDFEPDKGNDEEIEADFDQNLVETVEETELATLATTLMEEVEADEASRKDWFRRIEKGLELLGITPTPGENLPFEGASSVVHPLIAEGVVQFQARAISEMFPPAGPVRTTIVGTKTADVEAQADRVLQYMNYQLTEKDPDYFWNVDDMLFYLPLAGSAFKKVYYDPLLKMPVARLVRAEEFIVPYMATSLRSAQRYTHTFTLSKRDVQEMVASGYFADVELSPSLSSESDSDYKSAIADIADDRSPSVSNEEENYKFYEVHAYISLKADKGKLLPYHITIEGDSQKVVAIYRNWEEGDENHTRIERFVHYKYLPGLGFYGFGLLHIVGSVAEAAVGALRALLDTAAFSNLQGGFKSKDVKIPGGTVTISPGKWTDVETTAEDLNKAFFAYPFKEPSQALMELLKFLVDGTQRFMSTTEAMVGDSPATGPVGTTVALIEQGSKIFSAIHKRLHIAARDEFRLISKLNFLHMPDDGMALPGSETKVTREDFDGRVDVLPVSDPNIFSQTQRIAIAQNVLQLSSGAPDLYNMREVHARMLKAMDVSDIDALLISEKQPRLDPVTENQLLLLGQGVRAVADQNHEAHNAVHQAFVMQMSQQLPDGGQMLQAAMAAHMAEHMAHQYRLQVEQALGAPMIPVDLHDASARKDLPPEYDEQVAMMVAQAFPPQPPPPSPEELKAQEEAAAADEEQARKAAEAQAEEERKAREEQRKAESAANEEARAQAAFDAEQGRKDETLVREQVRKDAKALVSPNEGGEGGEAAPKSDWLQRVIDGMKSMVGGGDGG
jgi:hypothetical protein